MEKSIGIISHRPAMAAFYGQIFRELFGEEAEIVTGATEDGSVRHMAKADLYVSSVTGYDVMQDSRIKQYVNETLHPIRMDVTFSRAVIDLLQTYPDGTKALLVNQNKHMVMECIAQLYHLGISNIEFYPCYPGLERLPDIPLAITVGEPDLVPAGIEHTVDIGSRLPSANTVCETALKLGKAFFLEGTRFKKYRSRLASVDYALETISSNSLTAENRLEMILNSLDEGVVCVDERGVVTLINKTARRMLNVGRSEVLGRPAAEVLPTLPFESAADGFEGPRLLTIRGEELGAVRTPLVLEGRSLGAFLTLQSFRDSERQQITLRLQKSTKSHKAACRFEDIIGSAPAISKARELARRMAANDAAVLIQGESGVGKAVFAQAIHNASPRANEAFVPVNCGAVRDELLEAELFGVADTSPGGRIGLIEYAHRGTLFLEGIESMSPRLQASLLRMLQEKEITRVGSDEAIPVDIRVLSSSSADMLKRVQEGSFRRDLYYRLNVIALSIPPLRERRADISQLFAHFKRRLDADFDLTTRAKTALLQHRWEGNVRELMNCVEYLSYTGLQVVDFEDLPDAVRASQAEANRRGELQKLSGMSAQEFWVLRELGESYREQKGMGRRTILERCVARGNVISEHEVRTALSRLVKAGCASAGQGRGGSRLTEQGYLRYRRILYGDGAEP